MTVNPSVQSRSPPPSTTPIPSIHTLAREIPLSSSTHPPTHPHNHHHHYYYQTARVPQPHHLHGRRRLRCRDKRRPIVFASQAALREPQMNVVIVVVVVNHRLLPVGGCVAERKQQQQRQQQMKRGGGERGALFMGLGRAGGVRARSLREEVCRRAYSGNMVVGGCGVRLGDQRLQTIACPSC
jgi:hypothetical protein